MHMPSCLSLFWLSWSKFCPFPGVRTTSFLCRRIICHLTGILFGVLTSPLLAYFLFNWFFFPTLNSLEGDALKYGKKVGKHSSVFR
jgi:hypothetical protein